MIIFNIAPDLQLDMRETGVHRLLTKATQFFITVSQPAVSIFATSPTALPRRRRCACWKAVKRAKPSVSNSYRRRVIR
jgi:hypothetical protein